MGGRAQTDEPYLGRACVSSPATPTYPGALLVCLSVSSAVHTHPNPHMLTHSDANTEMLTDTNIYTHTHAKTLTQNTHPLTYTQ